VSGVDSAERKKGPNRPDGRGTSLARMKKGIGDGSKARSIQHFKGRGPEKKKEGMFRRKGSRTGLASERCGFSLTR